MLAVSQIFFVAGCNRGSTGGSGAVGNASTAAGATAGVNVGLIAYDIMHGTYTKDGKVAEAAALENRKDDFVNSINRILPADVSKNLFPTLLSLLPLVDDGTVEGAVADIDKVIVELMGDQAALDGLAKLLSGNTGPKRAGADHARNLLISRLLAYPELESLAKATLELIRANDGIDANGQPNGERNLLRELQAMASRLLINYKPSSSTANSSVTSGLAKLSDALLEDLPLKAFPALGAPAWSVRLDTNGNPKVLADAATGKLPVPFVDSNADGIADVNTNNLPVDMNGTEIQMAPFGVDGTRDSYGRALAPGGSLYFDYFDAKRTLLCEVLLLVGELLKKDVPANAVVVLDSLADRVKHTNGTPSTADDYETLAPTSPLLDLTHANFELVKHTPLPDLLKGLGAIVKTDPAKFSQMVDTLLVAMKKASAAAHQTTTTASTGSSGSLGNDLMPLLEDAMRPRGRTVSAVRALLEAFHSEQRRLRTLPVTFARMMKYHDYRNRIPASSTKKSVMHRILDMMVAANQCNAPFMGNMAEFYLDAMAGNKRILGINISISTIHKLLDVGFLRRLLCSGIKAADVRALKDFNDTGALDAMKPIAAVFSRRGETKLLKDIMLGLQKHYETTMRPTEPMVVDILESGAVELLFEVLDTMTQVNVPGSSVKVSTVLADTLQALIDTSTPRYDRQGNAHPSLMRLMLAPMDLLSAKAKSKGIQPQLDALFKGLGDVILQTYMDDNGTPADTSDDVEKWKWGGLTKHMGTILETLADAMPADRTARARWAAQQQLDMTNLLTGRDIVLVIDLLKTIASSPQKATINKAIANLFTPQTQAQFDVFGSILTLVADMLTHKPTGTVDQTALAAVLNFLGKQIDPSANRFNGVILLLRKIIAADDGLFILRVLRNTFDKGPNGAEPAAIETLMSVFDDISKAAGPKAATTPDSIKSMLQKAHDFINDQEHGLPLFIKRIKERPGAGHPPAPASSTNSTASPSAPAGGNAGPNGTRGI